MKHGQAEDGDGIGSPQLKQSRIDSSIPLNQHTLDGYVLVGSTGYNYYNKKFAPTNII